MESQETKSHTNDVSNEWKQVTKKITKINKKVKTATKPLTNRHIILSADNTEEEDLQPKHIAGDNTSTLKKALMKQNQRIIMLKILT